MENELYFVQKKDGTVSVVERIMDVSTMPGRETVPEWQEIENKLKKTWASEKFPDPIATVRKGDKTKLPNSRYFRTCWTDELAGDNIDVDMPKARDYHLDELRKVRNKKLDEQDIEFNKALEKDDNAKKAEVAAKKEALRNMPVDCRPDLDAITDPDILEKYMPDVLK